VREYIDKSTGIQTIVQMQSLADMAGEYGFVPKKEILEPAEYKHGYNEMLLEVVNARMEKFRKKELDVSDFTVKGAVSFLKELSRRGVRLYLASGTDQKDVINEAKCLGYASYFEGRIYGSVGNIIGDSKKAVIEKIIRENNLKGPELACFGDGPVELREVKKRNGLAIGIASDEVRRYGITLQKRTRLIKAGADLVIPDLSQYAQVVRILTGRKQTEAL
jgi:phosphoglycolate phosphatase-like HAD superfamily hydrolase